MKKILIIGAALSLICGCGHQETAPEEKPSTGAAENNSVTLDREAQERIGIKTAAAEAAQLNPELKGYGHVVDPATLAAEVGDVATARAANDASQAELTRLKTLSAQNNASERALQAAEATAAHDATALDVARLKLLANWGKAVSERQDLGDLVGSLGKLETALVRIDLPPGETLKDAPGSARIVTLDDSTAAADFLGQIPSVDPQTQSQSFLFLVRSNAAKFAPGAAVTGFLRTAGEPLTGVVVPRSAVVRYEGVAWVYAESNGTNFTRRLIALDQPMENGWFVTNGVAAGDNLVVTGAQTVFSTELSASGFNAGERD